MSDIHPQKPVICSDPELMDRYNENVVSSLLTSKCISAEEALEMMENGANFSTVVIVNGEGKDIAAKFGDAEVKNIELEASSGAAIKEIHKTIEQDMLVRGGIG